MKIYKKIIVVIIVIMSFGWLMYKYINKPKLLINGYTLSFNENKVYLDGAIKNPGVYVFKNGTKLQEIISVAGGFVENVNIQEIDFEYIVKNGEKIYIPFVKEKIYFDEDIKSEKININIATIDELMSLEGIGKKTAEKIVEYREKKEFEKIEDIMNVEGIGQAKFSNIKERIVVE